MASTDPAGRRLHWTAAAPTAAAPPQSLNDDGDGVIKSRKRKGSHEPDQRSLKRARPTMEPATGLIPHDAISRKEDYDSVAALREELFNLKATMREQRERLEIVQKRNRALEETFANTNYGRDIDARKLMEDLELGTMAIQGARDREKEMKDLHEIEMEGQKQKSKLQEKLLNKRISNLEDYTARLKTMNDTLRSKRSILRKEPYPPVYQSGDLGPKWKELRRGFLAAFAGDMFEDLNYGVLEAITSELKASVCLWAGISPDSEAEALEADNIFAHISTPPSDEEGVKATYAALAIHWCFSTNFHTDGLDSVKLEQILEAMARFGKQDLASVQEHEPIIPSDNLNVVREYDRLATTIRTGEKLFKTHEIPAIAGRQEEEFILHLSTWMSEATPESRRQFKKVIHGMMDLKCELLIARDQHRLVFIPPGTPLDQSMMCAVDEQGRDLHIETREKAAGYSVTLCQWPALVQVPEKPFPNKTTDGRQWRDALLESRRFFLETPDQYKNWGHPQAFVVEKAAVLVEPRNGVNLKQLEGGGNLEANHSGWSAKLGKWATKSWAVSR
jgi:hypothetical protein